MITADAALDDAVRRRRVHGMNPGGGYLHDVVSQNYRMSELEAACLRLGLHEPDTDVQRRRTIATRLRDAAPDLRWQRDHEHHLCVFRTARRDDVRERLAAAGVATHCTIRLP